jgi:uncharacterized CHY-type Zn-finger protein
MSNIEQRHPRERSIIGTVKAKELSLKQIQSVACPTCAAAIQESCELHSGALRFEPHRDRKLSAAEALAAKSRKK